jgi:N-acyl-D-aspartate/D-glutamate deacylase
MPEFDVVVRGGTVVDGTGIPRYQADVAVKDGRIAMISGKIPASGAKELDASGCIVAPGVIDLHTHYDAQLNWDPYATLSGWFGITTVTIGQCGFGFAPVRPDDRDLSMRMMNRIEAIPLESMRRGIRWDWETYPEFLDSLSNQGLGVNVASLFPFSPLRGYVMGMLPAREKPKATDEELAQMKQLFREGMKAGSFGFAFDRNEEDRAEDGGPIPSHTASYEEPLALAEVLSEFGVGWMGWTIGISPDQEGQLENLTKMLKASGRPLHVGTGPGPSGEAWVKERREEGFPVAHQSVGCFVDTRYSLAEFNQFDYMPSWARSLLGTPEERAAKLRDSEIRKGMKREAAEGLHPRTNWIKTKVLEVVHERNHQYEGLTIPQLAEKMGGIHPVDALIELSLDEGLRTEFGFLNDGPEVEESRARSILNPYTHVSVSDGGAHTRFSVLARWPVAFLSHWVRDKELLTLEQAHYKISAYPAWIAGYHNRGMLRMGKAADMIVYNLAELGLLYDMPIYSNDFPGGERRLVQKAKGLRYTMVNGVVTFEDSNCTDALPGKLLRSYEESFS